MSDKIKKFIDCYIPVTTCNLRCHYCYITQQHQFENEIPKFPYSAEFMAKALSKKRLGGTCCINFCGGGETLLPREMTPIIEAFLKEGHYIMVVTNGTVSARFDEIIQLDKELLKRLFFKFSFQYLELKRTNQMDAFFDNIRKIRNAGCSFSLEITPNDEIIPLVDEIKETALKNVGALPHITVARDNTKAELPILTNLSKKEYEEFWGQFNSEMFRYKLSVFNKKRKEFCYAGAWSYYLNLLTGDLRQCYMGKVLQNIYEDVNAPIIEKPIGCKCQESHCYNAHAWLTWGDIPEHKAPTYLAMRDRIDNNGEHWVKEPIQSFFQSKLVETNKPFNLLKKLTYR